MQLPDALTQLSNLVNQDALVLPTAKTPHDAVKALLDCAAKVRNLIEGPRADNFQEELGRRTANVAVLAIRLLVDFSLPFGTEDATETGLAAPDDRAATEATRVPPPAS